MKIGLMALAMLFALPACTPARTASTQPRDPSRITQDEIVASLAVDAYDAVAKLRANFFASRGRTSFRANDAALPTVFVDGIEYGPISSLRLIPALDVAEIRLYRSWEATTAYGTGFMSGVIAVTTRR
ncbi:MAG: hypothetical protein ABIV11_01725 [Gemmatimonadaceae bacterium]